jgi:GNAT superfamily N-acetyltransferase
MDDTPVNSSMTSDHDWSITTAADDASPCCDAVRGWLREYNQAANQEFSTRREQPQHQARPLVLLAVADSQVVGGLVAETQFAWLRISIMAIDPQQRLRGIGASLLAAAEREATARGCRYAYVDTMDYQAPRFYEKHGYTIVGRLDDWDSHGHAKLHLTKRLTDLT